MKKENIVDQMTAAISREKITVPAWMLGPSVHFVQVDNFSERSCESHDQNGKLITHRLLHHAVDIPISDQCAANFDAAHGVLKRTLAQGVMLHLKSIATEGSEGDRLDRDDILNGYTIKGANVPLDSFAVYSEGKIHNSDYALRWDEDGNQINPITVVATCSGYEAVQNPEYVEAPLSSVFKLTARGIVQFSAFFQNGRLTIEMLPMFDPSTVTHRLIRHKPKPVVPVDFSDILRHLKNGGAAKRLGWNGKGMFVYMRDSGLTKPTSVVELAQFGPDGSIPNGAYFVIKGGNGCVHTWVPSISDIMASDWIGHDLADYLKGKPCDNGKEPPSVYRWLAEKIAEARPGFGMPVGRIESIIAGNG